MSRAAANPQSIADLAHIYVAKLGFHLVPLPPREKRPANDDWGNNVLSDPDDARAYYTRYPDANMGVALGPSRVCSFDVDDLEATRLIFEEFGWDLDELVRQHPTIQGQAPGLRVMFRVPDGMVLPYHSLTWPKKDGTKGRFTVWEIRSADAGQQRQDVLPPSIHPDTGLPYTWITKPKAATGLLPPPDFLLQIWANWDALKPQFQSVCPWAEKPRLPAVPRQRDAGDNPSVIDAYNRANDIVTCLLRYGYKRQGRRYLSPHSSTGLAGVNIFAEDNKAFIHHASDPLCSTERNQPAAPFDLFCYYEHGGDTRAAVKAAAAELGMKHERPARPAPARPTPADRAAPASRPSPANIDPETGEVTDFDGAGWAPAANDNNPHLAGYDLAAVDWYSPFPDVTGKGKPVSTIENLQEALRRLGVTVRYNVIKKDIEILIPGQGFSLDNEANASLGWLMSACVRFGLPTDKLDAFLCYVADQNQYNPVANWITSKPWDGTERLHQLIDTIQAEGEGDSEEGVKVTLLKTALMLRWMISAVAGVFRPDGVSAHGVLVLQGGQYLGKTAWFKSLVPRELGVIQDGMSLRPDDKDSVKQVVSNWLVELGELDATFRKADIAALKAFLTRDRDVLRTAYARKESKFARRTVFFASVNPKHFLHDPTGNRRYWTISCVGINHQHGLDMQQVWAEVYENHYLKGEGWFLTPDEMTMLNGHNQDYEILDPIKERLQSRYDWDAHSIEWRWMAATDVMQEIGFDKPSRADVTHCGQLMLELNGNQTRKSNGRKLSLMPPKFLTGMY